MKYMKWSPKAVVMPLNKFSQVDPWETHLENNKEHIMFVDIYGNSTRTGKRIFLRLHCIFSYNLLLS